MKHIEIKEVSNGYVVKFNNETVSDKVYRNTSEFEMLEDLGKFLLSFKVKVQRQ